MRLGIESVAIGFCLWSFSHGAPCPNACSGHGVCELSSGGGAFCVCQKGWNTTQGPDCSLRECPKGIAWWDFATADDTAHAEAECSNMGLCDRETGTCVCKSGFEGDACERLACPSTSKGKCGGHGKCLSLSQAAEEVDGYRLTFSTSYGIWDADKIHGCICDEGYKGYDCSVRECVKSADPKGYTYTGETQVINCQCTTCTGYFYVLFRGAGVRINHADDASTIKAKLESLSTIREVDITLFGGTSACDNDGASIQVVFRKMPGDLPDLVFGTNNVDCAVLDLSTGGNAGTSGGTSNDGTAVLEECSGRGYCIENLGDCFCAVSGVASTGGEYGASDGEAGQGNLPDCGYQIVEATGCPLGDDGEGGMATCSGHGSCDGTTVRCVCQSGYTGYDCSFLTCPSGTAWFDIPTAADTAHAVAECSNMGHCDREEGTCECRPGFTGDACERLACPENDEGVECNGHGTCYSMRSLALLSEENGELRGVTYGDSPTAATWDHSSIYGCYCDRGYFHGPYAWDFSDYTGAYDCSLLNCPHGDNPQTAGQVNEVQTIYCVATGGTFIVRFREEDSQEIPFDATASELKFYLDSLFTISEVEISYSSGAQACSGAGNTITINFKIPGDLPLVQVDSSSLTGGVTVTVTEVTQGTTEFVECSGQGTCDGETGTCGCYDGYVSSDGSGDGLTVGQRGDCGAMYLFRTTIAEEELI